MDEELLESEASIPGLPVMDELATHELKSGAFWIDVSNHYGLIAIAFRLIQMTEIVERMLDVYWEIYSIVALICSQKCAIFVGIFRDLNKCREHYVPLETEPILIYQNVVVKCDKWISDLKAFLSRHLPGC